MSGGSKYGSLNQIYKILCKSTSEGLELHRKQSEFWPENLRLGKIHSNHIIYIYTHIYIIYVYYVYNMYIYKKEYNVYIYIYRIIYVI